MDTVQPNSENVTAFKAGTWYVFSSIMVKAVSVISTPIFTRVMSKSEYGTTSTFSSWYTLLITIFTLDLSFSIGRAKIDYPNKLEQYIGSMQLLSLMWSAILSMFAFIFIKPFSRIMGLSCTLVFLLILKLVFAPSIMYAQYGYRFRYLYKQNIAIAWYTVISTTVLSLILILFVPGDKSILRAVGLTLPFLVLSIYFWIKALRNKMICINKEFWRYGLKLSVPLIVHTISLNILTTSDKVIINEVCGTEDTAMYSLAYSYALIVQTITSAINEGWQPWFHDRFKEKRFKDIRENVKYLVVLVCYIGLAAIVLAPEFIYLLGGMQYKEGVYCAAPVVLGVICQYIYTHYVNIEMHLKKTGYISAGTIVAAVFNVITNILFIPKYGYIAAAYTTLGSYILLFVMHFCITKLVFKVYLFQDIYLLTSVIITVLVSALIIYSYSCNILRFIILCIGFLCFLVTFRKFLNKFIKKFLKEI